MGWAGVGIDEGLRRIKKPRKIRKIVFSLTFIISNVKCGR